MAKNEFLPFGTGKDANILKPSEWLALNSRNAGFTRGIAKANEINTALRQVSVIAHAVAQFIADTNNSDVVDNGDLDALKKDFIRALSKNVINTLPAASTTVPGITKLSSATNSNDETMAATPKAVKAAYDLASKVSVDILYPVGIVVWFAQNKNPNTLYPGTTWKYIDENRTVRLASANGSDVMTKGGSDSVTLAVGHLPAHNHTFSANTSTFDYGTKGSSWFDYGNKGSDWFDYGTKTTNITGNHQHTISPALSGGGNTMSANLTWSGPANTMTGWAGDHAHTVAIGGHAHTIAIGGHSHTTSIGAHSHSVSGTTVNTGSGTSFSVANSFIKLMGWYRSA